MFRLADIRARVVEAYSLGCEILAVELCVIPALLNWDRGVEEDAGLGPWWALLESRAKLLLTWNARGLLTFARPELESLAVLLCSCAGGLFFLRRQTRSLEVLLL